MKPGFVMYFENCQVLRDLPDAQYAAVMRALAEYAERLAEGQEGKTYLEQQKALLPREEARILDIMAGSVRRDHRKYQETIDRRSRKQPWAADREKTTASAPAMDDDVWKYV